MSIPRISFFTLLVILAITGIHSSPVGGKGSKSPGSSGGKKTVDENVMDIDNRRKGPEDIHENLAIDPQTVNKHADAVLGDDGYNPSNIAGPSESNPSHEYRRDFSVISTNPFNDALSSIDLGSKPKTLTQLSGKGENTRSDGASKRKASEFTPLSRKIDEMKKNLKRLETYRQMSETDQLPWDPQGDGSSEIPFEFIPHIKIIAPDVVSLKKNYDGSFEDINVPESLRTDPKAYKQWFMKTLPDKGFYRDKVGNTEVGRLKSVEQTKSIIKLQDYKTYGFLVPQEVLFVDNFENMSGGPLPEKAKKSRKMLNEWLREELPKYHSIELLYNPSLAVEYHGLLK